jgi:hypothetical protein
MIRRPYPFLVKYKNNLYKLFYGKFVEVDKFGKIKKNINLKLVK